MTEKPELRSSNPGQKVILIAEDDVVVRSIAQMVLEAAGYFVLSANDGADALNISPAISGHDPCSLERHSDAEY